MEDAYDVEVLACHACAARERKAYNRRQTSENSQTPEFGMFYVVSPEMEGRQRG